MDRTWSWTEGVGWQASDELAASTSAGGTHALRSTAAPAASSAASVLAAGGLGLTAECVRAAQLEHLDLAAAATILEKESRGRNVWGHDPVDTGGIYVKGGPVTQANYLTYRNAVRAGRIDRQGCGPAQCTSAGYQDTADSLGGCWDPTANMRSAFRGLGGLILRYGVREGFRRYNGSGPAAQAYAAAAMARYAVWHNRLSGASPTPSPPASEEDEMAVMPWTLPAGHLMERTIPIPLFPPFDRGRATLWLVDGWQAASIKAMYYVRDKGPGLTPQQEAWGGSGAFDLAPDDRPSFDLGTDCTSVAVLYDSPRDIQCLVVYPAPA